MHFFLEAFIKLFVAIDPIGTLPIFLALTAGMSVQRKRQVTFEAVIFGFLVCLGFMCLGNVVFHFVGVTEADFRIAGGIILLVLAMIDLLIPGKPAVDEHASIGLFPLAMPLIAGPAALTTTLVLANGQTGYRITTAALVVDFSILLCALLTAETIAKWLGSNALRAISKVVMVLLAAVAVNMIRVGIAQVILEMNHAR